MVQFIINNYLADSDMTYKEKLEFIGSSFKAFDNATEYFKMSGSEIKKTLILEK